jgi:plastocyanin
VSSPFVKKGMIRGTIVRAPTIVSVVRVLLLACGAASAVAQSATARLAITFKGVNVRFIPVLACGIIVFMTTACGGGASNVNNPASPSPVTTSGTTIGIVGDRGSQSFTPNPAQGGQGMMVSWRNNDGTTHRIVTNDGTLDTGNIAPGATSAAVALPTNGTNYHCTIHPGMIGAIAGSNGPPPCTGIYCGDQ